MQAQGRSMWAPKPDGSQARASEVGVELERPQAPGHAG